MDAQEIIQFIQKAEKKTPVKVYLNVTEPIEFEHGKVFGEGKSQIVFGDYNEIAPILQKESEKIIDIEIEVAARNSAVPLLDLKTMNARIEPGAIIRDQVSIGDHAVIMMGAIVNIGAVIGENTMIDMGAILGGRAMVGKNCHIGAAERCITPPCRHSRSIRQPVSAQSRISHYTFRYVQERRFRRQESRSQRFFP